MRARMLRRMRRVTSGTLLAAVLFAAPAHAADEAFASAVVPHAPDAVWAVLSDFSRWQRVFPSVASLTVDRVDARRVRLHTRTAIAGQVVRYTLTTTVDAGTRRIECTLDPRAPADVAALASSWHVREAPGGGARIELHVRSDSGIAMPGFVARRITERTTRQSVDALVAALDAERRVALVAAD